MDGGRRGGSVVGGRSPAASAASAVDRHVERVVGGVDLLGVGQHGDGVGLLQAPGQVDGQHRGGREAGELRRVVHPLAGHERAGGGRGAGGVLGDEAGQPVLGRRGARSPPGWCRAPAARRGATTATRTAAWRAIDCTTTRAVVPISRASTSPPSTRTVATHRGRGRIGQVDLAQQRRRRAGRRSGGPRRSRWRRPRGPPGRRPARPGRRVRDRTSARSPATSSWEPQAEGPRSSAPTSTGWPPVRSTTRRVCSEIVTSRRPSVFTTSGSSTPSSTTLVEENDGAALRAVAGVGRVRSPDRARDGRRRRRRCRRALVTASGRPLRRWPAPARTGRRHR